MNRQDNWGPPSESCSTPNCHSHQDKALIRQTLGTRNSELSTRNSELGTRNSELGTLSPRPMPPKTPSSTRLEMTELVAGRCNFLGKAFGGAILSMIDLCAYATASRFAGSVCVTASIDRVDFHEPIEVGEMVTMVGIVSYVGRTSVEVTIEVFAEDIYKQTRRHTNTARVTTSRSAPTAARPRSPVSCARPAKRRSASSKASSAEISAIGRRKSASASPPTSTTPRMKSSTA